VDAEELVRAKKTPRPASEGEHFLAHQDISGHLGETDDSILARDDMRLERPVECEPEPQVASLAAVEAMAIRAALEATRGNKAEAARKLGIDRGSLYAKLRRLQETEEDPLEAEADAVLRAG
jgi:DNA-binding NtrC family response regulator